MAEICLSFDNGPEPEATPLVLEVLTRRRIPAMFFAVGEKLRDPARRALTGSPKRGRPRPARVS